MNLIDERSCTADLPYLPVYWGDETDQLDDRGEPCLDEETRRHQAKIEAYWAGRNHAGRKSARIAA